MIQESGQDKFRSCFQNFLSGARKKNIQVMSKPFSKIFCERSPIQSKRCLLMYIGIFFTGMNLELDTNAQWRMSLGDAPRYSTGKSIYPKTPGTCVQYPGLQGGGALGDASAPGTPADSIAASAHEGTYSHVAVAGET